MTKWFDTNYHYLVPEIGPHTEFALSDDRVARLFLEAAGEGITTRPVIVGPVTLLLLSKAVGQEHAGGDGAAPTALPPERSEERRVGKECRGRWRRRRCKKQRDRRS